MGWKSAMLSVADNEQDAMNFARELITASPPYGVERIDSVQFAQTTVGEAKDMFDPRRQFGGWDRPDNTVTWAFVAYGRFPAGRSIYPDRTPGASTTVIVLVVKGSRSRETFASNEQYDLSELGTVRHLQLPLPKFPTPVALDN